MVKGVAYRYKEASEYSIKKYYRKLIKMEGQEQADYAMVLLEHWPKLVLAVKKYAKDKGNNNLNELILHRPQRANCTSEPNIDKDRALRIYTNICNILQTILYMWSQLFHQIDIYIIHVLKFSGMRWMQTSRRS